MNPVHLHLLLNHFPIIGTVLGISGFDRRFSNCKIISVKNVAFGLFIFTAVISVPTFLSGEPQKKP